MVKVEFRTLEREAVKDLVKTEIVELPSAKAFHRKIKELRETKYVLEYQKISDS